MTALQWLLVFVVAMIAAVLAVYWCWSAHEEAEQRKRIRHRANGGSDVLSWRPIARREQERR